MCSHQLGRLHTYKIHLKLEIEDTDCLKRDGYVNFMLNELMKTKVIVR
jgi:hypothetical protein